jgi:hypothetical protein
MKVIFTGDPAELEAGAGLSRLSTSIYGVTFPMGAEVDVSHLSDVQKRKLLNNPHFRPAGVDAPSGAPTLVVPKPADVEALLEANEAAKAAPPPKRGR